ncbi:hypothetical protein HPB50_003892 [Hyalomma asiaticum]|uniref:Uncharacterized protein n=1 Tax=Hyalomma asiaticum TaxID=266040 RepID=A0ACB7RRP4_HYAAI|nr:hypothetical protein HPB50_003892 [Hyalomma asiaticum]
MDRRDEKEQQHRQRPAGATSDEEILPSNDSWSPGRRSSGQRSGANENGQLHQEPPQAEQPLDFSLKNRTQSSASSSPTSGEDEGRRSPANDGEFRNVDTSPRWPNPTPWSPVHANRLLLMPATSPTTTEATSLPLPATPLQLQNYMGGLYAACGNVVATVRDTPLMTALPSPPTGRLCDSAAAPPALVRPSPSQQPAFPCSEVSMPATSRSSPPSSGPTTTAGKYVRPFKAYQRGELAFPGIASQYLAAAAPALAAGLRLEDQPEYAAFRAYCLQNGIHNTLRNGRHQDGDRRSKTTAAGSERRIDSCSSPPALNDSGTGRSNGEVDGDRTSPDNSNSSLGTTTNNGDASTHVPDTEDPKNGARNGGGDSPPNGGAASAAGPVRNGRRRSRLPDDEKDSAYWERRRKNNEAAKKSRDARRAKEDEIAIRAAYLERKNTELRLQNEQLRTELSLWHNSAYARILTGTHQ